MMSQTITIRRFQVADAETVARLFHDTVRTVNIQDYSRQQVEAWAPDDLFFRDWAVVCSRRYTVVAEVAGAIAGFGELEAKGQIDCFYCHKDYQGQGIGRRLYQAIEAQANSLGLSNLLVEASITARPFFERIGFKTVAEQTVMCRGQTFTNYVMKKILIA